MAPLAPGALVWLATVTACASCGRTLPWLGLVCTASVAEMASYWVCWENRRSVASVKKRRWRWCQSYQRSSV
ncbi:hypothetical protein D9M68_969740 [compost metagenome]